MDGKTIALIFAFVIFTRITVMYVMKKEKESDELKAALTSLFEKSEAKDAELEARTAKTEADLKAEQESGFGVSPYHRYASYFPYRHPALYPYYRHHHRRHRDRSRST